MFNAPEDDTSTGINEDSSPQGSPVPTPITRHARDPSLSTDGEEDVGGYDSDFMPSSTEEDDLDSDAEMDAEDKQDFEALHSQTYSPTGVYSLGEDEEEPQNMMEIIDLSLLSSDSGESITFTGMRDTRG